MRAAISLALLVALAACSDAPQQAETNNSAITDVEALPPDESVETLSEGPADELANGAAEPVDNGTAEE